MDALGIIAIILAVIGIAGGFLPVVPEGFMKVTGGPRLRQKGQSFMDCMYESI